VGSIQIAPVLTLAALLTTAGTLAGLLIQQAITMRTARLGRHSDRILKTFETKLDVFTEFLVALDEVSEVAEYVNTLEADPKIGDYQTAKTQINEWLTIGNGVVDYIERKLKSDPPPQPDEATALRARARREAQQMEAALKLTADPALAPYVDKMAGNLKVKQESFETARANLNRLGIKLALITDDDRVGDSLRRIVERLEAREKITPADREDFMELARKSIGIAK
jgi:hypothetical protein